MIDIFVIFLLDYLKILPLLLSHHDFRFQRFNELRILFTLIFLFFFFQSFLVLVYFIIQFFNILILLKLPFANDKTINIICIHFFSQGRILFEV